MVKPPFIYKTESLSISAFRLAQFSNRNNYDSSVMGDLVDKTDVRNETSLSKGITKLVLSRCCRYRKYVHDANQSHNLSGVIATSQFACTGFT